MLVYRIARTRHIRDLSGIGARLYGGRWNHPGTALLYASESRSLATVEFLVHLSMPEAPAGLSIATLEIPDDVRPGEIRPSSLPGNWREHPAPAALAELGTKWARANRGLLLRVPSAVVEGEYNLLINPAHADMPRVAIARVERYRMNSRLAR
jgi:RES domain-containing protein